jgi:murein DD-endopeptidase MepM/ murein hydrolase activator NlpD
MTTGAAKRSWLSNARAALEGSVVVLCLWAGLYYTPMGALVRSIAGAVTGSRTSARSLLSYYSGNVGDLRAQRLELAVAPVQALSPDEALGYAAFAAYRQAPEAVQQAVRSTIVSPTAPTDFATALHRLRARGLDEDAAMLVLFAGEDAAQFAERRAVGEGRGTELEDLSRQLPPGYEASVESASLATMLAVGYRLGWPGPISAPVTSPFGWRTHPVSGEKRFHKGIDLGIPTGTEVRAAAAGVVVRSSEDAYNGNIVVVAHGHGARTLYLHNSVRLVSVGTHIAQGELIARSGMTGIATGPHLHYQLELGGEPYDPLLFSNRPEPEKAPPVVPPPVPKQVKITKKKAK